jgi:isopentenyl-diphosphate delta-isomerase
LKPDDFQYLTRLHYIAKDEATIDPKTGEAWGEAEIDYILVLKGNYQVSPNPEEIDEIKYVNIEEFQDMINPRKNPDLKWSPWFRIIASHFLIGWWKELDEVFKPNNKFMIIKPFINCRSLESCC